MSEQTLTSLAILTVNWDRGHDTLESFVPLVAESIRQNGGQPVSLVNLQDAVKGDAGIKIPSGALQAILGRCGRKGLVRRANNVYYPEQDKLDDLDYATDRGTAVREHAGLIKKLRTFADERYDLKWSEEEAEAALLGFLQSRSVPVLAAAVEGDPLPDSRPQSRKARHVVSSFAGHLSDSDDKGFGALVTVVKGHILSGVLFYPDVGKVQNRFDDLDVYCDTPFLLPAIAYGEEGLHLYCLDLIELLTELGRTCAASTTPGRRSRASLRPRLHA